MPSVDEQDFDHGPSRVGEVLGERWRLTDRLGGGGMGEVYRAVHIALGRTVAIKLLRPEHALNAGSVRRVLREGQAASRVVHPNIVRIEDVGVDGRGLPYLVQEYLDGVDLDAYADSWRGVVPARELLPLMIPALDALASLHEAGILHRDLKPGNVFLVRQGSGWSPRLLDFGLAAIDEARSGNPRITGSTVTLGSPAYMSPEQFRDPRSVTPHSDIWSCGVMLYELLSGVLPFTGATVGAVAIAVSTEAPVPLDARVPTLPPALTATIMSCLLKDPARRPSSVRALIAACEEALRSLPPSTEVAPLEVAPSAAFDRTSPAISQVTLRSTESDPERPRIAPRRSRWPLVAFAAFGVVAVAATLVATRAPPRPVVRLSTPVTRRAPIAVVAPPAPSPVVAPPPAPQPTPPLAVHASPRTPSSHGGSRPSPVVDAGLRAAVVATPPTAPIAVPVVTPVPVVAPPVSPLGVGIDPQYR